MAQQEYCSGKSGTINIGIILSVMYGFILIALVVYPLVDRNPDFMIIKESLVFWILYGVLLTWSGSELATSLLLIDAARNGKYTVMKVWIWIKVTMFSLTAIVITVSITAAFRTSFVQGLLRIIIFTSYTAVILYSIQVVRNYCAKMLIELQLVSDVAHEVLALADSNLPPPSYECAINSPCAPKREE